MDANYCNYAQYILPEINLLSMKHLEDIRVWKLIVF